MPHYVKSHGLGNDYVVAACHRAGLRMRGPVEEVCAGDLSADLLRLVLRA